MFEEAGFADVRIGAKVDTFGGAPGEGKARAYDVHGYSFLARNDMFYGPLLDTPPVPFDFERPEALEFAKRVLA